MNWIYQESVLEAPPEGFQGFVYIITLRDGRKYIGKKNFYFKKYKQVKGKKKAYKAESDWKEYTGSSDYVNEIISSDGLNSIKKEIIHLCKTKSDMSYLESYEIFVRHALLKDEYLNGWVSVRINKRNVFGKITLP